MNYQGIRENAAKKLANGNTRMEMSAIEAAAMGAKRRQPARFSTNGDGFLPQMANPSGSSAAA